MAQQAVLLWLHTLYGKVQLVLSLQKGVAEQVRYPPNQQPI